MHLLRVSGLNKRFRGLQALCNVDLEIEQGEIFGLIGPNGAGKTTLFNTISGFFSPTSGSIEFKGENIAGLPPYKICSLGLSRTFQIVKPFGNLTVLENVMVGAYNRSAGYGEARSKGLEALEFTGLMDKCNQRASEITVPDQRRLELARALATGPDLLLLDEVMAGLTPAEINDVMNLIREINGRGVTVFIIEHLMKALMGLSHRVLVLHHGERIALGTPFEIVNDRQVIEAYLGEAVVTIAEG